MDSVGCVRFCTFVVASSSSPPQRNFADADSGEIIHLSSRTPGLFPPRLRGPSSRQSKAPCRASRRFSRALDAGLGVGFRVRDAATGAVAVGGRGRSSAAAARLNIRVRPRALEWPQPPTAAAPLDSSQHWLSRNGRGVSDMQGLSRLKSSRRGADLGEAQLSGRALLPGGAARLLQAQGICQIPCDPDRRTAGATHNPQGRGGPPVLSDNEMTSQKPKGRRWLGGLERALCFFVQAHRRRGSLVHCEKRGA